MAYRFDLGSCITFLSLGLCWWHCWLCPPNYYESWVLVHPYADDQLPIINRHMEIICFPLDTVLRAPCWVQYWFWCPGYPVRLHAWHGNSSCFRLHTQLHSCIHTHGYTHMHARTQTHISRSCFLCYWKLFQLRQERTKPCITSSTPCLNV